MLCTFSGLWRKSRVLLVTVVMVCLYKHMMFDLKYIFEFFLGFDEGVQQFNPLVHRDYVVFWLNLAIFWQRY